MSNDFDDLFVVIGGDKKAVKAVKKALKKKIEEEERTCENADRFPAWEHKDVKPRPFRYGWNGFERPYEESVDLCQACFEAMPV